MKVEWSVVDLDNAEDPVKFVTLTPNADDKFAVDMKVNDTNGGRLKCTVTLGDKEESDASRFSTVAAPALPNFITDLPATLEVDEGAEIKLDVKIDQTNSHFRWMKDDVEIRNDLGSSEDFYYIGSAKATDAGTYWVELYHEDAPNTKKLSNKCVVTVKEAEHVK